MISAKAPQSKHQLQMTDDCNVKFYRLIRLFDAATPFPARGNGVAGYVSCSATVLWQHCRGGAVGRREAAGEGRADCPGPGPLAVQLRVVVGVLRAAAGGRRLRAAYH